MVYTVTKVMKAKLKSLMLSPKYFGLALGVFFMSRLATILFPYDSDHWIFYYVGRRWLDGDILYLQVWDHKSPLIFAINGGMHAALGGNIVAHRIFLCLVALATLWLFYLTAKRVFEYIHRQNVGLDARVATLLFAVFGSLSQFTNSGNNTENFGVLALIIAVYCYLRWRKTLMWKWLIYSGAAISCLLLLKINFGILLLPLIIDFVAMYRRDFRRLAFYTGVWILPTLIQAGIWLSYFAPRNLVHEFVIATISFNGKYLRAGWAGNLSGQLVFVAILGAGFLFFVGAYYFLLRNRRTEESLLLTIGVSALLFSVILGTFYTHYFLVVIPYFCLVFGSYWRQVMKSRLWILLASLGLVLSFGISGKQLYNRFYGPVAKEANKMEFAASYVKGHTSPHDKIIFYGYGATFYQLAGRDSGSRYISASHPLIDEREGFGYDFTGKYIGDMATTRPKYVVFDRSTTHVYGQNKRAIDYFNRRYEVEVSLPGYEIWKIKD